MFKFTVALFFCCGELLHAAMQQNESVQSSTDFICVLTAISTSGKWSQADSVAIAKCESLIRYIDYSLVNQQKQDAQIQFDEQLPGVDVLDDKQEIKAYYADNSVVTLFVDHEKKQCRYVRKKYFD